MVNLKELNIILPLDFTGEEPDVVIDISKFPKLQMFSYSGIYYEDKLNAIYLSQV